MNNLNQKPDHMSQLYWDVVRGKVKEHELSPLLHRILAIEKHVEHINSGGIIGFDEFYEDIKRNGLLS